MDELTAATKVVRKHHWLWLLPVALSLFSLWLQLLVAGEQQLVPPGVQWKATIPTSIPTMSDILSSAQPDLATASPGKFLLMLPLMLIGTFLTGGYLAGGIRALHGEAVDWPTYWADCRRFFARLLLLDLLLLFVGILVLALIAAIHMLLFLIAVVAAFVYLFFWPIAIVREDLTIKEGFERGHTLLRANWSRVIPLLLIILLASGLASLPINWLAQSFHGYLVAMPIWSFIGSIFSVAVLCCYDQLVSREATEAQPADISDIFS